MTPVRADSAHVQLWYDVITEVIGTDAIQRVFSSFGEKREEITRIVYCLQEAGLRQALIDLGWTPPPDET